MRPLSFMSAAFACVLSIFIAHLSVADTPQGPAQTNVERDKAVSKLNRIPSEKEVIARSFLSGVFTRDSIRQIPATVIDKGILKWIPYNSYRCVNNYELNIYGDPENPAAVEIGIYPPLVGMKSAEEACRMVMMKILTDEKDQKALALLDLKPGKITFNGLTIEITAATDEDAYGAWWIGIYDEPALEKARATAEVIEEISVAKREIPAAEKTQSPEPSINSHQTSTTKTNTAAKPSNPGNTVATTSPSTPEPTTTYTPWNNSDLAYSRGGASGGGRVYVRGYTRKDGTYVQPHTRSKPRK